MFFKKCESFDGLYVDTDGKRYDISATRRTRDPQGINCGYTEFATMEDAIKAWGLTASDPPLPSPPTLIDDENTVDV